MLDAPAMPRTYPLLLGLSAGLLLLCSGCVAEPDERPPVVPTATVAPSAPRAPSTPLTPLAPLGPISSPGGGGPLAPVRPQARVFVEQSEGAESARLRAAFAPAEARVSECVSGSGGVVRLRVVARPDGARLTFEPSSALGPRERRCVLEALSTVDVPSAAADPTPTAKPSGFTALFRIEW